MKADELLKRIEAKTEPQIIDPRAESEFKKGHIPGAINALEFDIAMPIEETIGEHR